MLGRCLCLFPPAHRTAGLLNVGWMVAAIASVATFCAATAGAQPPTVPPRTPVDATARPVAGKRSGDQPVPRLERLTTPDGVGLTVSYYPSDRGKEAVPVLIVHELAGQGSPYRELAESLWEAGCAVIVPDLRGHGNSKHRQLGDQTRELDVRRMNRQDIRAMVQSDLETVKKFLIQENDAEMLNLNALVMVGIGEGAILASHWAMGDLNFPSVGALKQGQDVKALVLIAPEKAVRGLSLDDALGDRLLMQLPVLMMVGETSEQAAEADRSYRRLDNLKKRSAVGLLPPVQFESLPTSLAGHRLVNDVPGVIDQVRSYIVATVVNQVGRIPWVSRRL